MSQQTEKRFPFKQELSIGFRLYPSRQTLRHALFMEAKTEIDKQYSGEPHYNRRLMARRLSKRRYREMFGLGEIQ